ncbi:MAG TPA: T9SS type A sorting domain-containing protein [Flavipsychrobacter sp.]|nr:T9SS type A sorting domain-containing protein [Flavipsychrobacter sp.]
MRFFLCALLIGYGSASAQNLIDNYLSGTPTYTVIANSSQQVSQPRDLDFKPFTNELWIINKGTSNGGSNVIIYNAGEADQTTQYRMDSHTGHFMIFPSAIAFGDDGKFANTNEIKNTASPTSTFMGPALWSADTSIFATVFQNNWVTGLPLGSHLDMLHQSPFSMGVAHDSATIYWVFDGHNGNLCKYDFGADHSPGYDDHSNGRLWRYTDIPLTRVANIPGHMIKDKSTGWLYIIDAGTKKLKRVNTKSGTVQGTLTVPASGAELLQEYRSVTGATLQVLDSFLSGQPCGIDLYNGRLIVGDFNNGTIHVYDITGSMPVKLGTIATGQAGMMGLKIGADGKIWFVNQTLNTVVRMDPSSILNNDIAVVRINSPVTNAFETNFYHPGYNQCATSITPAITIKNTGANTLTSATINYVVDNGAPVSFNWTGSLASGATATVTLPNSNVASGAHKLSVEATLVNNVADSNPANNKKAGSFRALNPVSVFPFSENFSSTTFPPVGWIYLGHNFHNEMTHEATVGKSAPGSVKMDNYSGQENISGQRNYLITPRINFANATSGANITFALAYAPYDASSNDALQINVSSDCGATWTSVYNKSGTTLSTTANTTAAFTPGAADWKTEVVSLSAYAGQPDILVQFLTTSGFGNNIYLDDIAIANGTAVDDQASLKFSLYPNPVKDRINIEVIQSDKPVNVSVYDIVGKVVKQASYGKNEKISLDVSDLQNGNYIVKLVSGSRSKQEKVVIVR